MEKKTKQNDAMQWYNGAGGTTSFGHQSPRDRSDVLDVVTTKDDGVDNENDDYYFYHDD